MTVGPSLFAPERAARACAAGLALAGALCLDACATNEIAGRAIQYNIASEQAHNREMLLNVVRASQRRPLEFTELQSISATAGAEADGELDVPITQNGAEEALELVQKLNLSERPTFQVSVLDTQEFYQGILRPLSTQTLDFYLKRGLPRRLLFELFLSGVTVEASKAGETRPSFTAEFENDVTDDARFDDFQALIEALVDGGLTTATVPARSPPIGPPLTAEDVAKGDIAAKAATGGFQLREVGWCDLNAAETEDLAARLATEAGAATAVRAACAAVGAPALVAARLRQARLPQTLYRMEKPGGPPGFVLCLRPDDAATRARLAGAATCDTVSQRRRGGAVEGELRLDLAGASPQVCAALNRNRASGAPLDCAGDAYIGFRFSPRSTFEVIRYLGEVVRRQSEPPPGATSRLILVKTDATHDLPAGQLAQALTCHAGVAPGAAMPDGGVCLPLFRVGFGKPPHGGDYVAINYAGRDYYVASPPAGEAAHDPTLEIFQLLGELMALNRSAKDVPASTVFTIVAP